MAGTQRNDSPAGTLRYAAPAQVWGPLVLLWILWGSTYLGIAIVVDELPPLLSTGLRVLGGALLLGLGLAVVKGPAVLRITGRELRSTAILGVGIPGVALSALSLAERYVPSGIAALVVAGLPMWIVVIRMVAGGRPARTTLIGVVVGLIGLAYLLLPGGTVPRSGTQVDVVLWTIVLVAGSMSWAYFSWRSGSMPLPRDSLATASYELLFAGLFQVAVGFTIGEHLDLTHVSAIAWTAWSALAVATCIGYATYTWLIARAPLSLVSTYAYVNPLVAVILGAAILGEAISRDVVWGLVVVLGGVVLVVRGERIPS